MIVTVLWSSTEMVSGLRSSATMSQPPLAEIEVLVGTCGLPAETAVSILANALNSCQPPAVEKPVNRLPSVRHVG